MAQISARHVVLVDRNLLATRHSTVAHLRSSVRRQTVRLYDLKINATAKALDVTTSQELRGGCICSYLACLLDREPGLVRTAQVAPLQEISTVVVLWRYRTCGLLLDRKSCPARTRRHTVREQQFAEARPLAPAGVALRTVRRFPPDRLAGSSSGQAPNAATPRSAGRQREGDRHGEDFRVRWGERCLTGILRAHIVPLLQPVHVTLDCACQLCGRRDHIDDSAKSRRRYSIACPPVTGTTAPEM